MCSGHFTCVTDDLSAMRLATEFVRATPGATYADVTAHISDYFELPDFSPWICEWIEFLIGIAKSDDPEKGWAHLAAFGW